MPLKKKDSSAFPSCYYKVTIEGCFRILAGSESLTKRLELFPLKARDLVFLMFFNIIFVLD